MNAHELEYCDFGNYEVIKNILSKAFEIKDFTPVINAYDAFKKDFFKTPFEELERKTIKRKYFKPITSNEGLIKNFFDEKFTIGFDVPVLIKNKKEGLKGCAFIVSEDPLRDGLKDAEVILSTPFGTHLPKHRDNKNKGKLYWDFAIWLLEQGYSSVYFTDIKKLWIKEVRKNKNETSKLLFPQDLLEHFRACLEKELNDFEAQIIIAFGKDARESIQKINPPVKVIDFIHPTFTASSHWRKDYKLPSASAENKLNYMKGKFLRNANENPQTTTQITHYS